jgi:proline dehydrogenase
MVPLTSLLVASLSVLPKFLVRRFAMRYIAGEHLEDAVRVAQALNARQIMGTIDVLGENVTTEAGSLRAVRASEEVLDAIHGFQLDANLSLKPTQFGLKLGQEFCYANLRRVLDLARHHANFVRIDMEDSSTTDATLELYGRLRSQGYENVGVVIQANLRRSEADVINLTKLGVNVRLCKGAYVEPGPIAFQGKDEIRQSFVRLLEILFDAKCYVGLATHDEYLIRRAFDAIRTRALPKDDYEFQMLHGVKPKLRDQIVADGHRLRIYIPFGEEWHAYSMRRFRENPQLVRHVLRALLSGRE